MHYIISYEYSTSVISGISKAIFTAKTMILYEYHERKGREEKLSTLVI